MPPYTITEHFIRYFPERLSYAPLAPLPALTDGFILRLRLSHLPQKPERVSLLCIPGVLTIEAGVHHFPDDMANLSGYEKGEYYDVYADAAGNSPYLEAAITLHAQKEGEDLARTMRLGIPLHLYDASQTAVYLLYDGVRFAFLAGGEIVNCNFPFGTLHAPEGEVVLTPPLQADLCQMPAALPEEACTAVQHRSIAFYSPRGYNLLAGDIVNFYHNGTYHYLILQDRHHHGNRFGGGAHSTRHLTTRDFIHWEDYGELVPLQAQWETFGTGTMCYADGHYYYTHGLHTSRMLPYAQTGSSLLDQQFRQEGCYRAVDYAMLREQGLTPSGTNYLISEDGIHFRRGEKQFHCSENPSIYADPAGGLLLYAGYGADGTWHAPHIDGPWTHTETDMPLRHNSSPVRNSTECPSIFSWNGYRYLIMGFRGYWQAGPNDTQFTDLAATGEDIYDGLGVPMVACCDGRYILSGWVGGSGWAYVTQHRELIQHENGRLGMRWLPELTPDPAALPLLSTLTDAPHSTVLSLDEKTSYYLELHVAPQKTARVGLAFSGQGESFVLDWNTGREKVQAKTCAQTDVFPAEIKALYEYLPDMQEGEPFPNGDLHTNSHDFAIAHVQEITRPYCVKLLLHYEKKGGNLIVDTEIGGGRTFITNRPGFRANAVRLLCEDACVTSLSLYRMPEEG